MKTTQTNPAVTTAFSAERISSEISILPLNPSRRRTILRTGLQCLCVGLLPALLFAGEGRSQADDMDHILAGVDRLQADDIDHINLSSEEIRNGFISYLATRTTFREVSDIFAKLSKRYNVKELAKLCSDMINSRCVLGNSVSGTFWQTFPIDGLVEGGGIKERMEKLRPIGKDGKPGKEVHGPEEAELAWKLKVAQCDECATMLAECLKGCGASVTILSSGSPHAFPVINYPRGKGADPDNPWTWGDAYIADPWENRFISDPWEIWNDGHIFDGGNYFVDDGLGCGVFKGNTTREAFLKFAQRQAHDPNFINTHLEEWQKLQKRIKLYPKPIQDDLYEMAKVLAGAGNVYKGESIMAPSKQTAATEKAPAENSFEAWAHEEANKTLVGLEESPAKERHEIRANTNRGLETEIQELMAQTAAMRAELAEIRASTVRQSLPRASHDCAQNAAVYSQQEASAYLQQAAYSQQAAAVYAQQAASQQAAAASAHQVQIFPMTNYGAVCNGAVTACPSQQAAASCFSQAQSCPMPAGSAACGMSH